MANIEIFLGGKEARDDIHLKHPSIRPFVVLPTLEFFVLERGETKPLPLPLPKTDRGIILIGGRKYRRSVLSNE